MQVVADGRSGATRRRARRTEAVLVPLYAPRRLAAWRSERGRLALSGDPYRLDWRFNGDG